MAGYTRTDTTNNIADGNIINAADLDNEFDGIQAAFNSSTGHNHDGTTGEGAPILVLGPSQDVVVGASTVTPKTTNTVDIGSSSLKFKDLYLAGNASFGGTLAVTGVATFTAQPVLSSLTASRAVFTDGSKGLVSNAITGTGNVVMSASPTLTGTITAEALTTSSTVTLSGGTANGVAYLNGSKVVTSGSALTFDGSTLATTGALTVDGNATLGNASTDTVTVNGYMAVGGAVAADTGLRITSTALTGFAPAGIVSSITTPSTATTAGYGVYSVANTAAASFTQTNNAAFWAANPTKGAGSTITNQHGVYIADQTQGTNNYGITSLVSSGTNKWNIYASGTAANYFAGNVLVGDTTSTTSPLSAGSFITASSTTGSELILKNSSGIVTGELVGGVAFGNDDPTSGTPPHYSGIQARSIDSSGTMTLGFYTGLANYEANTPQVLIDASGNMGVGTSSPDVRLFVSDSANDLQMRVGSLTAGIDPIVRLQGKNVANTTNRYADIKLNADAGLLTLMAPHTTGPTIDALNIDSSGNIGLGVAPSAWGSSYDVFEVRNAGNALWSSAANDMKLTTNVVHNGTNYTYAATAVAARYDQNTGQHIWYNAASGTAGDTISWTQAMTLNASGNLGLGVTPSAWTSGYKALQVGLYSALNYGEGKTNITTNAYYNGTNWIYGASDVASMYKQGNGHIWYNAASGTAGNAISFTQAMTLDASGRLLIGTTSSRTNNLSSASFLQLEAVNSSATGALVRNSADTGGAGLILGKSRGTSVGSVTAVASGDRLGTLSFSGTDGTSMLSAATIISEVDGTPGTNDMPGRLVFSTTADGASSPTERMRIDSSGNLGIGTSSPTSYSSKFIEVSNATSAGLKLTAGTSGLSLGADFSYIASDKSLRITTYESTGFIRFNTQDTERARIDSSGNLLVAKTSSSFSTLGAEMRATGQVLSAMSGSTNSTETLNVYSTGAAVQRFYVGLGGTVYATSTSISAISDSTLKENVRDLETGLSEVMALKPRRFDWKNGDAQNVAGFVAQEVEQVLPELVQDYVYRKDEENGDIIKKSLKMGDILPTMVKAIQEQQSIITALTARVAALESN